MASDPREDVICGSGATSGSRMPRCSGTGTLTSPLICTTDHRLWHSRAPSAADGLPRAGKSTLSEEAVIVEACLAPVPQRRHHRIVLRARGGAPDVDQHEFETNRSSRSCSATSAADVDEGKIILSNGVVIQAFGRASRCAAQAPRPAPGPLLRRDLEEQEDVETRKQGSRRCAGS